jgi:hypothetical protein
VEVDCGGVGSRGVQNELVLRGLGGHGKRCDLFSDRVVYRRTL